MSKVHVGCAVLLSEYPLHACTVTFTQSIQFSIKVAPTPPHTSQTPLAINLCYHSPRPAREHTELAYQAISAPPLPPSIADCTLHVRRVVSAYRL